MTTDTQKDQIIDGKCYTYTHTCTYIIIINNLTKVRFLIIKWIQTQNGQQSNRMFNWSHTRSPYASLTMCTTDDVYKWSHIQMGTELMTQTLQKRLIAAYHMLLANLLKHSSGQRKRHNGPLPTGVLSTTVDMTLLLEVLPQHAKPHSIKWVRQKVKCCSVHNSV